MKEAMPTSGEQFKQAVERMKTSISSGDIAKQRKELVSNVFEAIREECERAGGRYVEDINELYRAVRGEQLVVRRENPERLVSALVTHEDLPVGCPEPQPGQDYPNCSIWRSEDGKAGLDTAFMEGREDLGGLVSVVGFEVGKDMKMGQVTGEQKGIDTAARQNVRRIDGVVHPEDVRFLIVRAPGQYFPAELLTAEEADRIEAAQTDPKRRGLPVFRGFLFNEPGSDLEAAAE